jgi:hypothetical protein
MIVDAAIVRTMKGKKTSSFTDLSIDVRKVLQDIF